MITAPGAPDEAALEARDHRRLRRRSSPTSRCPRAVYVVDEFPTGTLDKILKNKLREMADERPAID